MRSTPACLVSGLTDSFASVNVEPVKDQDRPIVDTHQHLWDLDQVRLAWLNMEGKSDAAGLDRSFLMDEYLSAVRDRNVVASVYMEVNVVREDQRKEAEAILKLCRDPDNPMCAAVIGACPDDPSLEALLEDVAGDPLVKGVRTVLHDPDRESGRCLKPEFVQGCQLLGERGLSFDLCMRPGELLDAVKLVDSCPQTRFVLDHCGNMPVQGGGRELNSAWRKGISELAARETVDCKISGIVVTAAPQWQARDLAGVVNECLDTFGEDRVCFGGDWPVCTLRTTYGRWVDALEWIVRDRSAEFRRKLFHDNALRIYRL